MQGVLIQSTLPSIHTPCLLSISTRTFTSMHHAFWVCFVFQCCLYMHGWKTIFWNIGSLLRGCILEENWLSSDSLVQDFFLGCSTSDSHRILEKNLTTQSILKGTATSSNLATSPALAPCTRISLPLLELLLAVMWDEHIYSSHSVPKPWTGTGKEVLSACSHHGCLEVVSCASGLRVTRETPSAFSQHCPSLLWILGCLHFFATLSPGMHLLLSLLSLY